MKETTNFAILVTGTSDSATVTYDGTLEALALAERR